MRTGILNKTLSLEDKWKNFQMPDKNQIESLEQEAAKIITETKNAQTKQPQCQTNPQGYDQEFQSYKTQIENLQKQNTATYKIANNYAQIKQAQIAIAEDIQKIGKTITKYEAEPDTASYVAKLKNSLSKLKEIQAQLETYPTEKLSRMDELKANIAENNKTLESLRKPTHEFAVIKRTIQTEKTLLYPDPELPMVHDRQTSRGPMEEKCVKCGAKRKSTSVTIG